MKSEYEPEPAAFPRAVKVLCGIVAILVGVVGAVLAAAIVVRTWTIEGRLQAEIPKAVERLETVIDSVDSQCEATVALLDSTRERVQTIRGPIQELADRKDQALTASSILAAVDEQLLRRLESAEQFARSMQASVRNMSNALALLDSVPFLRRSLAPESHAGQWKAVAASLSETADLLGQVSTSLAQARSGQTVSRQQLQQLSETLSLVESKLGDLQDDVRGFSQTVDDLGHEVAGLERDASAWLKNTALAVTIFFVCFGCSQLSLLVHGWQLLKRRV